MGAAFFLGERRPDESKWRSQNTIAPTVCGRAKLSSPALLTAASLETASLGTVSLGVGPLAIPTSGGRSRLRSTGSAKM